MGSETRFVWGDEAVRWLDEHPPQRIQDLSWFRRACSVAATPFILSQGEWWVPCWYFDAGGGKMRVGSWGGWFLDGEPWKGGPESIDDVQEAFVKSDLKGILGMFSGVQTPLRPGMEQDEYSFTRLLVKWSSFDEFMEKEWSSKGRNTHKRQMLRLRRLRVSVDDALSFKDFVFLVQQSVKAASRLGQAPICYSPMMRAAYWNLYAEAGRHGVLRVYRYWNGPERVGVMTLIEDRISNRVNLQMVHGEEGIDSIGKLMYESLLTHAINGRFASVSGGLKQYELKSKFRFEEEPAVSWIVGES